MKRLTGEELDRAYQDTLRSQKLARAAEELCEAVKDAARTIAAAVHCQELTDGLLICQSRLEALLMRLGEL